MNDEVIKAILAINPSAVVHVKHDDLDRIEWLEGTLEISKTDIQAKIDEFSYVKKRKLEYPSIHDLVVALYDTEDKSAIDSKRAEIKLKYPKPI